LLLKASFYDPNPLLFLLEHKGLYWSKVKGTLDAKMVEPDEEYNYSTGKGKYNTHLAPESLSKGPTCAGHNVWDGHLLGKVSIPVI
jgi:2-oxoisovalerate dehydrogenase E1 component